MANNCVGNQFLRCVRLGGLAVADGVASASFALFGVGFLGFANVDADAEVVDEFVGGFDIGANGGGIAVGSLDPLLNIFG